MILRHNNQFKEREQGSKLTFFTLAQWAGGLNSLVAPAKF